MTFTCLACRVSSPVSGNCHLCGDAFAQILNAGEKPAAPAPDWPDQEAEEQELRTVRRPPTRSTRTRKAVA